MPNYLPDHLHCALTLPPRDVDFANRIKSIKFRFVRAVAPRERRFRERAIRDEADYVCHLDYVHDNPVKHGLVAASHGPYSTFHR